MAFRSLEEVIAREKANADPGIDERVLREAFGQGRFGSDLRTIALVRQRLDEYEQERTEKTQAAERALREREVTAQEVAANAASDSATSARHSKWAAAVSALAALIALIVSVVAYLRPPPVAH
jgi:cytochrome c-type biogenesis protein CcmH/NrfG